MFQCKNCKRTFKEINTEEEAYQEARETGVQFDGDSIYLCDECYEFVWNYLNSLPKEDREKLLKGRLL